MDFKNWRQLAFLLCIMGCVDYVILTAIAMFFYGGGSEVNPNSQGFSLFENYFGDLILATSHSGNDNTISRILASTGSILFSIFLIPALIASFHFFSKTSKTLEKKFGVLGISFGVLFALDFIALILFYYNFYLALFLYIFLLLSWIFYLIAFYVNKELPRKFTYLLLITLIIYLTSVPFYFQPNHTLIAISQKVIWYTLLAYFAIESYFMIKQLES